MYASVALWRQYLMDIARRHEELKRTHEAAKFRFIVTELDLAITFCQMAISADTETKAIRNAEHARRAHEAAARFLDDATLERAMAAEIRERMAQLGPMLQELNQHQGSARLDGT
jgi:hypothetical protein